jgi:hypothetical protein
MSLLGLCSMVSAKSIWIMAMGLSLEADRALFQSMWASATEDASIQETRWIEALDGPKLWSLFNEIRENRTHHYSLFLLSHGGWGGETSPFIEGATSIRGDRGEDLVPLLRFLPTGLRFLALITCHSTEIFRAVHEGGIPKGLTLLTFDGEVPPIPALEIACEKAKQLSVPHFEREDSVFRKRDWLRCHVPGEMRLRLESGGKVLIWIQVEGPATLLVPVWDEEPFPSLSQISQPLVPLSFCLLGQGTKYELVLGSSGKPLGGSGWVYRPLPRL